VTSCTKFGGGALPACRLIRFLQLFLQSLIGQGVMSDRQQREAPPLMTVWVAYCQRCSQAAKRVLAHGVATMDEASVISDKRRVAT
jgi:hypothetical protein